MQRVIILICTKINKRVLSLVLSFMIAISYEGCISEQSDDSIPLCFPVYHSNLLDLKIQHIDFEEVDFVDALGTVQTLWHQVIQSQFENEYAHRTKPRIIILGYDSVDTKVTFSAFDIPVFDAINYMCRSVNWSTKIINGSIICYPNLYSAVEWDAKSYKLEDEIKNFFGIEGNKICDIRSKLIEFGIDEEISFARWEPMIDRLIVSMPKNEFVKLEQIFKCILLIKTRERRQTPAIDFEQPK